MFLDNWKYKHVKGNIGGYCDDTRDRDLGFDVLSDTNNTIAVIVEAGGMRRLVITSSAGTGTCMCTVFTCISAHHSTTRSLSFETNCTEVILA